MGVAARPPGHGSTGALIVAIMSTACISPLEGVARRGGGAPVAPLPAQDAAATPGPPARPGDGGPSPADARVPPPIPGGDAGAAPPSPPASPTAEGIASASVVGFELLVRWRNPDGSVTPPVPFDIRGVSWSPADRGSLRPLEADYRRAANRNLPLMRAASINVVKTYGPLDAATLDELLAHGIFAIITVFTAEGNVFEPVVQTLRDHPAVLMWMVGNEWNLNRLYQTCTGDACSARVEAVARRIKQLDPRHPVATSFAPSGELPGEADLRRLPSVDVWGLNIYSQPGFFNRFNNWRLLAQQTGIRKPFFLSEYGADAYDNLNGRPDLEAQAQALRRQTAEIRIQLSAHNPAFPCLGGTPFEWNDEWWKRGNPGAQDAGGFANDGVAADRFANEEWWGIVDVERNPRPAYQVLKELYAK